MPTALMPTALLVAGLVAAVIGAIKSTWSP
jgi:hypothetical protein